MVARAVVCMENIERVMDLKKVYQCCVHTVIDAGTFNMHTFNLFGIYVKRLWHWY